MEVVLRGRLSNPPRPLVDLSQYLTIDVCHQDGTGRGSPKNSSATARRLGAISNAVVAVLTAANSEMRVRMIHADVERLLGETVSFYSVADYLRRRSKGSKPLFLRTRYGHYRLLAETASGDDLP